MTDMTGGQAIIRTLVNYGADVMFCLPGVQLDNTFDGLYEARNQIRTIHARHEHGAVYMALAYAQASGKVGVCLVGPGPSLLNAGARPFICPILGKKTPISEISQGNGIATLYDAHGNCKNRVTYINGTPE